MKVSITLMKKSRHIESKATWLLWCGMFVFLVMWGLSGCPSPKPGQETQEEPGLEQGKEIKKEPDANEPSQEDGKEALSDAKDAADTPEPVSEPTPEPEPTDNPDGGPDVFGDGGSEGRFENIPEEPVQEFVPKDDICGGKRPCVTTYAGQPWDKEGPALAAWFDSPTVASYDGKDNIYIWDVMLSKMFAYNTNTKRVKLVAGNGVFDNKDGPALQTPLSRVVGMAFHPNGELYMSTFSMIRKLDLNGNLVTVAGSDTGTRGDKDGIGKQALFSVASGLAFDSHGILYIADEAKIRTYDPKTGVVSTFAGTGVKGYKNGPKAQAQFTNPRALVFDLQDNLYVLEDQAKVIRQIDRQGNVSLFSGTVKLPLHQDLGYSYGMGFDKSGMLYITDRLNDQIIAIDKTGKRTVVTGGFNGYTDGSFAQAQFFGPCGSAFDSKGNLYIVDGENKRIRMLNFSTKMVSTVAGDAQTNSKDGPADWAVISTPESLALAPDGTIYVSSYGEGKIRVISPSRIVSTLPQAKWAMFIACDRNGVLYTSRLGKIGIYRAGKEEDYAGNGVRGYQDGPLKQASFSTSTAMYFDANNNMYVSDGPRIRFIDTKKGMVSTFAVSPYPTATHGGITMGPKGNIYVVDYYLDYVAKVSPQGTFSILAGTPGQPGGADGKGQNAKFTSPYGIAVDQYGIVYVTEKERHTLRRIDLQGNVTTIVGKTKGGFFANGWGDEASFYEPQEMLFDGKDALYIADFLNHRIRKVLLR